MTNSHQTIMVSLAGFTINGKAQILLLPQTPLLSPLAHCLMNPQLSSFLLSSAIRFLIFIKCFIASKLQLSFLQLYFRSFVVSNSFAPSCREWANSLTRLKIRNLANLQANRQMNARNIFGWKILFSGWISFTANKIIVLWWSGQRN